LSVLSTVKYAFTSFVEYANKSKTKSGKPMYRVLPDMAVCCVGGVSPSSYYWSEYYKLNRSQRRSHVTYKMSKKIQRKCNSPQMTRYFRDKTLFAEKFSEYMSRKTISTIQLSSPQDIAGMGERIIYKPLMGSRGGAYECSVWPINLLQMYLKR